MSDEVIIKKPTIEELQTLLVLWKKQAVFHINLDSLYYCPFDETESVNDLRGMIEKDKPNLRCAYVNGTMAGFITFEKGKPTYPDTNFKEFVEILELYVDDVYRNHGIGEKLMAAAEQFAHEQKIDVIEIRTSTLNTAVIPYYEKRGYINRQTILYKTSVSSRTPYQVRGPA